MYLADNVGTPFFDLVEASAGTARLLIITAILFVALMSAVMIIMLLLHKRVVKDTRQDKILGDPFGK